MALGPLLTSESGVLTNTFMVRCKCSTARVTAEVSERGYLIGSDASTVLQAAISRTAIVGRLPGGFNLTAPFYCVGCRKFFKVEQVKGRRTGHECDAKCMASKGPTCECACGGKNHGASYA